MSELTGKTWRTIRKRLDEANVQPLTAGRVNGQPEEYDSVAALAAIYVSNFVASTEAYDPHRERARKDAEYADKIAMENAVRRGELVEGAAVAGIVADQVSRAKARMLQIPDAVAQHFDPKTGGAIAAEVRRLLYEALGELAGVPRRARGDDSGGLGAAARPDGERVGGPVPEPVVGE